MGSGVVRKMTGALIGTGAILDVVTVGFRPKSVKLINVASADEASWVDKMADGEMLKRLAAGGASLVVTNGVTPLANGFRLGADADLNVSGEKVVYEVTE